jgi:sialate O-acetylesterase
LSAVGAEAVEEHPFLHPLFCDHAVLPRGVAVPIWGWSAPGAKISVSFAGQTRTTVADNNGKWLLKLKSMRASSESRTLSVTNFTTHESAVINDVLVGDVWLCSGQSNMEMGIGACNATNDIATANFPLIRLLTVPHRVAMQPVDLVSARWLPCSPESKVRGPDFPRRDFSSVAN